MRVFLGGTCNSSTWRERLIPMLKGVDYFNPVVKNWDAEAQANEKRERETCDYVLYVITPRMAGVYAIAEAVQDSNKRPEKTIFCMLAADGSSEDKYSSVAFTDAQKKSLEAVGELISSNHAHVADSLESVAAYLNKAAEAKETA